MVTVVPRTLKRGDVQFVTGVITELAGQSLATATFQVAHILDSAKSDDQSTYPWETEHASSFTAGSIHHAKKLVTAAVVDNARTKYRVFVRVTDSPEIDAVDCGTYSVVP